MKKLNIFERLRTWTALMAIPMMCIACGSATSTGTGSGSDSSLTSTNASFPSSLSVSSPTDYVDSTGTGSSSLRFVSTGSTTYHAWATGRIDQLLGGTTPSLTLFTPELFFTVATDADCYGPSVNFEDHPEDTGPATGQLPSGDLGLWEETDSAGDACASAQIKARMETIRDSSTASLMVLASMVGALDDSGQSLPDASTTSVDLVDEMNTAMTDAGRTDATFSAATINYNSSDSSYSYAVTFTHDDGTDTRDISIAMNHVPGSTTGAYTGTISYQVDDSFTGGNCPSNDVTNVTSLQYNRVSVNDISTQVRSGQFCGHGVSGLDANGITDPSDKYDAATNTSGWANNFSIFTANYDASTFEGDYAYSWQAGYGDSNARVFNLHVDSSTSAIAYFGFGDDIEDTDGSISGFICNWAGPGSDHTLTEFAQYQELSIDATTGVATATTSKIDYAPTTTCDYDGASTFVYDKNGDGDLTDTDEDSTIAVSNDMEVSSDINSDGDSTIEEVIDNAGFIVPTI